MDTHVKYEKFLKAYIEAYQSLKKADQYTRAQELWNKLKNDEEKLNIELLRLKSRASHAKSQNLKSFFSSKSTKNNSNSKPSQVSEPLEVSKTLEISSNSDVISLDNEQTTEGS